MTIFAKQYMQEFLLFVESNLMLTKKHLFLYIILLFILTLTIAISIGRVITQSKLLQKLQNRAARIKLNVSNDISHTIALCTLGWKPLETESRKSKAKMMHRIINY